MCAIETALQQSNIDDFINEVNRTHGDDFLDALYKMELTESEFNLYATFAKISGLEQNMFSQHVFYVPLVGIEIDLSNYIHC